MSEGYDGLASEHSERFFDRKAADKLDNLAAEVPGLTELELMELAELGLVVACTVKDRPWWYPTFQPSHMPTLTNVRERFEAAQTRRRAELVRRLDEGGRTP